MGDDGHQLQSSLQSSHASPGDAADDRCVTDGSEIIGVDLAEDETGHDAQNKAKTEEFAERGMGVAGKE